MTAALGDHLIVGGHIHQIERVIQNADDQGADQRAEYRSDSACETRSADDGRGDRVEFVSRAPLVAEHFRGGRSE